MRTAVALVAVLLAVGCGGESSPSTLSQPTTSPTPTHSPVPPTEAPVHFDRPEEAMRYLASAYNRHDLVELRHVTDPIARAALEDMRKEATNLQLDKCTFDDERRDYHCTFTHDYPAGYTGKSRHGTAGFTVGPADKPGWYMTVLEYCG